MSESEKEHGFMDVIKSVLGSISQVILASVLPPIAEGAESVMKKIEDRLVIIEKRIIRKIYSLMLICVGGLFLVFSLLFFLIEYLNWSKTTAFFSIGILIFVIGLLLKIGESDK